MAVVTRATLLLPVLLSAFVSDASGSRRSGESELAAKSAGRIAFVRGTRELVVVDSNGRNRRSVVRMPRGYEISVFSWAPSGRRLAVSATTPGFKERLYVVGANGQGLRRLAQWEDFGAIPVWSPRGTKIAFDKHDDGEHSIWVINVDGSGARRLTRPSSLRGPSWSPDGRRIALAGPGGVYVMRANGRQRRLVIRTNLEGTAPVWSPANKIAFYVGHDLWIANPDGTRRTLAIKDGTETYSPGGLEFSRDGRKVAFSAHFGVGNGELLIGDVSTWRVRRLTDNNVEDYGPSWSPDGAFLAFGRYRAGRGGAASGPGDIYVLNADGSGERNLTRGPADEYFPAWAPR